MIRAIQYQLKVKIIAHGWKDVNFERNKIFYSTQISLSEADALLCLYSPDEEMLSFEGPKLWVSIEPSWHSHWTRGIGRKLVNHLKPDEFAYYSHPDPVYRVPHLTSYSNENPYEKFRHEDHLIIQKAIAVVSNYGGNVHFLKKFNRLRKKFILYPTVELFGRQDSWNKYRHFPAVWKVAPPSNYCGEIQGSFDNLVEFISKYKVNICLENSYEPHYFTEKFVNAVRAGCIPIYYAHPTVRANFLKNAAWVDPSDFDFNPLKTLQFALAQDANYYRKINDTWLDSGVLNPTTVNSFYSKIYKLIEDKLFCRETS